MTFHSLSAQRHSLRRLTAVCHDAPRYMAHITSSAIGNSPPPDSIVKMLKKQAKVAPLNKVLTDAHTLVHTYTQIWFVHGAGGLGSW